VSLLGTVVIGAAAQLLALLQVSSVRAALDRFSDRLDEALLSNCFAWIKKCQDDGMDTMVTLLQKVLQLYAAKALKGQETQVRGDVAWCGGCDTLPRAGGGGLLGAWRVGQLWAIQPTPTST